jgi:hypothetical protein
VTNTEWVSTPIDIDFYPNPTSNALIIDTKAVQFSSGQYQIFNQYGQQCGQGNVTNGSQTILCEHLAKGMYHISLNLENKHLVTIKFVKL